MVSEALTSALEPAAPVEEAQPSGPLGLLSSDNALAMIGEALPSHMDAKAFQRHAITLVKLDPKLLECEAASVAQGIVRGAALGLDPDPALGHMWLVPRNIKRWDPAQRKNDWVKVATFQVGYHGLRELAERTGKIARVEVSDVRTNDHFQAVKGTGGRLVHEADWYGDRGDLRGWYAYIENTDGNAEWATMSVAQVEAHRDRYAPRRGDDKKVFGPWVDNFPEMAQKTVFIQAMKWVPKSVQLHRALDSDDKAWRQPLGADEQVGDVIDLAVSSGDDAPADPEAPEPVA